MPINQRVQKWTKLTKRLQLFCYIWLPMSAIAGGCYQTREIDLETVTKITDELPKDYTASEYEHAINQYSSIAREMNQKQLLHEVKKVTTKLDQVIQNVKTFLHKELRWLKNYRENWDTFTEANFKKFHQVLTTEISKNFYLNEEEFIHIGYDFAEKNPLSTKTPWSLFSVNLSLALFGATRTEFFIHKLLILCNQFVKNSSSDINQWKRREKRSIFNLAFDLNYWIRWYETQKVITFHGPRSAWSLANLFFIQHEIMRFKHRFVEQKHPAKLLFKKWLLHSKEFAMHENKKWNNIENFVIPFLFLRDDVEIKPFKKLRLKGKSMLVRKLLTTNSTISFFS